jgi:hypothetical protein
VTSDTAVQAWRVEAGERETLTFTVLDADGQLFPLDGWAASATIRDRPGGTLLYTFPAENVAVDTDENSIVLTVPAPVSAGWTFTLGHYSVFITDPATDPDDPATYRVLAGAFVVDPT